MHIKKNTMAKVVNQNDLKDVINSSINIIKSSVMFASDVASIVSTLPSIDENDIKKIQNVSNNIKSIVSCLDVSKIILNILNEYGNRRIFDPLLKLKMKLVIKRSITAIDILIQEIGKSLDILSDDIMEKMDKLKKSETFKNLTNLFDIYKLISDVKLSSVYDPKMLIKQRLMIRRMMSILSHIVQSIKGVFENPKNEIDDNLIKKVDIIIEIIDKIKSIDKIKIGLFITIKLKLFKKAIKIINDIVIECSKIDLKHLKSADQKIGLIKTILNGLTKIFIEAILISPLTVLVPLALFSISLSLLSLKFLIWSINSITDVKKSIQVKLKILAIISILTPLAGLFTLSILIAPIAAAASLALLLISLSLLSLKLLIWTINSITNVKKSIQVKLKILAVTSILTSLAGLFALSILIAPIAAAASLAMLILIGSIYLIYLGIKLISLITRSILKGKTILGLLALLIVFSILTVIATMMGIIALISMIVAENAINILILMGIITAVVLSVGLFAFVLGSIIVPLLIPITIGLVSMVFIVGMITLIATMLILLSKIELDPDRIKKNVESVINTALMVINCIFGGKDEDSKESNKSWIVSVIEKFAGGLTYIIGAIMAISFLATTIVSILLITVIASQLRLLQELNLDPDKIRTNIQNIFDICNMIKNQLFSNIDESKSEEDSNIGSIIGKFFKPMADIANALSMFKFLSISLVAIGGFSKLAKHLQTINEFNGIQNIDQKISSIKSLCSTIIQGISEDPEGYTYNKAKNKISIISDLLEAVYDYGRMNSQDVENMTKITDGYIKFFDKINSVDLTQLKTTVTLFEKLAEFSESINGNFEGLAESLNEKIAPLLEELKKIMDGVGQKVEKSGANTSASIFAANQQSLSTNEMHQQVDRQLPNGTDEQKEKLVQQMMEKQAQQQTNSIISKLEDFIQVFKSGQYSEARL